MTSVTECELDNLELLMVKKSCLPYKIVARDLHISLSAVRMRYFRISEKLGVENRAGIIVKAIRTGLVNVEEVEVRTDGKD